MAIYALGDIEPRIDPTAYISPEAVVIGDVTIGAHSSIWPHAVLRGDDQRIEVGDRTSIQDGAVIHVNDEFPSLIGSDCVVGHLAHIEGTVIHDHVLIGSAAVTLRNAVIESWCIVGAGALVPGGKLVPSGSLAVGVPAKIIEGRASKEEILDGVGKYVRRVDRYRAELRRIG
ncbi:MAG: gamma carbonic anhydrase family protein [Acidimicrobiia bacterium]|nr:gamma carbonic anhydrase family protein [Acidimicrobiia bacterium]